MTNLEYIRTLDSKDFVKLVFEETEYMCMQRGEAAYTVWRKRCFPYCHDDKYGCTKCRINWLDSEVGQIEKELGIDCER